MKKTSFLLSILVVLLTGQAFTGPKDKKAAEAIKWMSFEEAVKQSKKTPKKIFIDVYTDWCGWCKRMDVTTFANPVIARHMNKYFYAVKLDAEMKDTVKFRDVTFVNPAPNQARSTHQLAYSLLNGKLGYPTSVLLDEKFNMIQPLSGYLSAEALEPILVYLGQDKNKTIKWEDYQKTFKSELKAENAAPAKKAP